MFDFLRDLRKSDEEKQQESLSAYLDGALTPTQMVQFEQRLSVDADLRSQLEQQRQIKENLRLLPRVPAPRYFTLDPAVYGRPQSQPGFPLYPALRTATVLVALLLVFAVSFDLFTGTVSAPGPAAFESAVGELAVEDQTLEQALPAEEPVASEPLEESAIVASEAIEAPAEIEAEVIEEAEADASTVIGADETPLEERSTNFFQQESTGQSPREEEEAEELLAEDGLALESVLATPQPPKAPPQLGGAGTAQPQATATKATTTGIDAAVSEGATAGALAQPSDDTASESVLTREVVLQPTIPVQATVQVQAMLPPADVDQADRGFIETVASPIRLFEAVLGVAFILLVIATLASRRWR